MNAVTHIAQAEAATPAETYSPALQFEINVHEIADRLYHTSDRVRTPCGLSKEELLYITRLVLAELRDIH